MPFFRTKKPAAACSAVNSAWGPERAFQKRLVFFFNALAAACSAVNRAWGPQNVFFRRRYVASQPKKAAAAACSAVNSCWGYRTI